MEQNREVNKGWRGFYSDEEKSAFMEEWRSCGQSVPEFCRNKGLLVSEFYQWKHKIQLEQSRKKERNVENRLELNQMGALRRENEVMKEIISDNETNIRHLEAKIKQFERKSKAYKIKGEIPPKWC